jgi:hypothetical protein
MEIEELKQKALQAGKYYCKGFGDALDGVNVGVEGHLRCPEKGYDKIAVRTFQKIENFYSFIPFSSLQNELFYPLFVVADMLPIYKEKMNKTLVTQDDKLLEDMANYSGSIKDVGDVYRKNVRELLKEITTRPEGKNFCIHLTDLEGKDWELSAI